MAGTGIPHITGGNTGTQCQHCPNNGVSERLSMHAVTQVVYHCGNLRCQRGPQTATILYTPDG